MRRVMSLVAGLAVVAVLSCAAGGPRPQAAPENPGLSAYLPAQTAARMDALAERFDERAAMDLVVFMDQFWRNAANAGFNASIDRIHARLGASGFAATQTARPGEPAAWVEEFGQANGWDYTVGTLTLMGEGGTPDEVLLSRDRHRVALCINSFSTPAGGVEAPVVDVGQGATDADYATIDVRGAIVLGDAGTRGLWQMAVVKRGAIGVISTTLEDYIRPGPPSTDGTVPRDQWDVLQWGSVPYDDTRKAFGFKASPRAAARIPAPQKHGAAKVRAEVSSSFSPGKVRTLVAEIPGRTRPAERIVMVAHIQEPGANDDASGCATQVELARAIVAGVRDGRLPQPERTLTFLWVDEIRGSRQWLTDHPAEAKLVRYMFALDMTGEDTAKTGGTFLIEKMPDPTAVWNRPSDPHTEWGGGSVKAESLKGSFLNDVFLAVCQHRARQTGWVVGTNPYEGGSDHSPFLAAGVPALLAWHFPDRFYHSNLDRPDKTSAAVMEHVGVSVAATALLLATATEQDAVDVVRLVEAAAASRMALERRQGAALVAKAGDTAAAEAVERQVAAAWVKWFGEALDAVSTLPAAGPTAALEARIAAARKGLGG